MRKIIWLVMLAPAAFLFASSESAVRITRSSLTGFERQVRPATLPAAQPPAADVPPESHIGKIDTIGGYDYSVYSS